MRKIQLDTIRQVFRVLWQDIKRCDIFHHAYSMAYVSLLSLVPSLAAIFAVLTLFSPLLEQNSDFISSIRRFLLQHLAAGSGEQVISYFEQFLGNLDLKKIGMTGFAGTLVTLILLLKQIELALNHIFQVHKPRNLVTRFVNFWTFSTLGAFSLALFIGTISTYQTDSLNEIWSTVSSWVNKFIMVLLFSLIYKLIPNCNVKLTRALFGGLFATFLLHLAGKVFQAYIVLFSNYEAIYGAALAAIPTFLLWLYIIWIIVLLGALLTWRTQQGFDLNLAKKKKSPSLPLAITHEMKFYLLPAIMIKCYEVFQEGEGKGISSENLSRSLSVPQFWVDEAVDFLEDKGLVLQKVEDHSIHPEVFIRYNPEKMTYKKLESLLGLDLKDSGFNEEFLRLREQILALKQSDEQSFRSSIDQV